ncbi:hypothetical protein F1737_06765 [Methanoplanus sp. FWC-SCC4]|uniref:Uncharacterized protein n=1 Tax=Methanochimaera problematica TaxID=2609417 RepID=A0AA97I2M1_9EURY|nr:hypothetical protein F1737_06765 [Methanoplanus sp. FWC-SCC4]
MTSFVAGFAVFSALGYLAHTNGVAVTEVVKGGIELVFVAYPAAISAMPLLPEVFGIMFFLMIVMLGIDSAFSMVDSTSCALQDYIKIPPLLTTAIVCIVGFIGSMLFASGGDLYWLDIVDHYVWYYLVIIVGLLEALAIGYVYGADKLREYFNQTTDLKVGKWWDIMIKYITPAILGLLPIYYIYDGIVHPYGGYEFIPTLAGWMIVIGTIVAAFVTARIMRNKNQNNN